jgi:hypothetical protein
MKSFEFGTLSLFMACDNEIELTITVSPPSPFPFDQTAYGLSINGHPATRFVRHFQNVEYAMFSVTQDGGVYERASVQTEALSTTPSDPLQQIARRGGEQRRERLRTARQGINRPQIFGVGCRRSAYLS